jgi:FtsP/CotA-like multicopper oxidase with cupredoxin domain
MKREHHGTSHAGGWNGGDALTGSGVARDRMRSTRRSFLTGTASVSALALAGLPKFATAQAAPGPNLLEIGEVRGENGKLRAVVTVKSGQRLMPADPTFGTPAQSTMLRYFEGKDSTGKVVWPPATPGGPGLPPPALPGPTLRARVGDVVEITFLNQIHADDFGSTMDRFETGLGCDTLTQATDRQKLYPDVAADTPPDCFHGSTTVNMHFHGTHVTPDGLGDNVLLQLRPNPNVTEDTVRANFAKIFDAGPPDHWHELPQTWRDMQLKLLKDYDDTAVWQGQRGSPDHPVLPHENQLLPQAQAAIDRGEWPQYQIGGHPFCFKLTEYAEDRDRKPTKYQMGQCPGTHWYHAHKHGSTAINVYNGMAGVFVIEGAYDDTLKKLYPTLREKVLIVQNLSETPSLLDKGRRGSVAPPALFVNGLYQPVISMRPGEIQLWRLVNASVRAVTTLTGFGSDGDPEIRQIAQDGVQFKFENYQNQPLLGKQRTDARPFNTFAAGNRADLLVKAPDKAPATPSEFLVADTTSGTPNPTPILFVKVEGDPVNPPMLFPTSDTPFPEFPHFLKDIADGQIYISRRLDFSWEAGRSGPGAAPNSQAAPHFMIDGKQFHDGVYNQTMVLGDAEEWTLTNSTAAIAHPFHIHINPFQVIEVFDPASGVLYRPKGNYVWQDTVAIPPATYKDDGTVNQLGHVKIRHRFVDFTGSYVLHCHMLAHEDRGMMQLVRVVSNASLVQHH